MKSKVIFFLLFFLSATATATILMITDSSRWLVLSFLITAIVAVVLLLRTLIKFVNDSMAVGAGILAKPGYAIPIWKLDHFEALQNQQLEVANTFHRAAGRISALTHKLESSDEIETNNPIDNALRQVRSEMTRMRGEEEKRTWINQGLAQFSDILRNKTEIKEYSSKIISSLVKYVSANQGGLFIAQTTDSSRYLELTGCYAYDKRKFLENKIQEGEGLLGQCMLEKDMIFITDIPKDYVRITSGLGAATPRNIVVMPLMFNQNFYGAIELALFEIMPPHAIEFLRRVSENIASEIASLKNIGHTQQLLNESNELAQELKSREEEMKQNLEELAATQEEMTRKQSELTSYLKGINNTIASAEFTTDGQFKEANEIFMKVMGFVSDDLSEKSFDYFMGDDPAVVMMWENLRLGKFFSGEFKMRDKNGKELWLTGTFNPIFISGDVPQKIMMFAQFTTQEKEKMNELTSMVGALKSTLPVLELSDQFSCKTANEKFLKLFGLSRLEVRSKTIFDFIDSYYHGTWNARKKEILTQEFTSLRLPIKCKDNTFTYEVSISVNRNLEGSVSRVILLLVREVEEQVPVLVAI